MRDREPQDQAALLYALKEQSLDLRETAFCAEAAGAGAGPMSRTAARH
jgi:hypothetical protein